MSDKKSVMKLSLFLNSVFLFCVLVVLFAPSFWLWLFCAYLLYYEAFSMAGGFFSWLNKKKERNFEVTCHVRKLVAVDLRLTAFLIFPLTFISLVIEPGILDTLYQFKMPQDLAVLIERTFLLFQPLQIIHMIVVLEKVIGVSFGERPPLCRLIGYVVSNIHQEESYIKHVGELRYETTNN